jgi:hypothetical protein
LPSVTFESVVCNINIDAWLNKSCCNQSTNILEQIVYWRPNQQEYRWEVPEVHLRIQ